MFGIDTGRPAINIFKANTTLSKSIERLSTSKKLRTDSPSYVSRSDSYRKDISTSTIAIEHLKEVKEYLSVALEANDQVASALQGMRELAVASTNTELSNSDRTEMYYNEFAPLRREIEDISTTTQVKDTILTNGSWIGAAGKEVWVGPDTADTFSIVMRNLVAYDLQPSALAIDGLDIQTTGNASAAVTALDTAIDRVIGFGNTLASSMNGMDQFVSIREVARNNLESMLATVEDIDIAREMVTYTKQSVIQQASISMMAQGNLASQNMLALFA